MTIAPPDLTATDFPRVMRDRTVRVLKTMNTLAGGKIEASRATPVDPKYAPCIIVYHDARGYIWQGDAAPQYEATGDILVVGYVAGSPMQIVEHQTEILCEQIVSLMNQEEFLKTPVMRIADIDVKFMIKGDSDVFEGYVFVKFAVKWTEIFEPVLAPFSGAAAPGAYGAPFSGADVTDQTQSGVIVAGATVNLLTS